MTTLEIEIALIRHFDVRLNTIVPNITHSFAVLAFETDLLVINKSGFATGIEIKISKADLKADFKKMQHTHFNEMKHGKVGLSRWYGKFKTFYYAVPKELEAEAIRLIPPFCGLITIEKEFIKPWNDEGNGFWHYHVKRPKGARILPKYKWSEAEISSVRRLGTMRILTLKETILKHKQLNQ